MYMNVIYCFQIDVQAYFQKLVLAPVYVFKMCIESNCFFLEFEFSPTFSPQFVTKMGRKSIQDIKSDVDLTVYLFDELYTIKVTKY